MAARMQERPGPLMPAVVCPTCGSTIPLTEALTQQIREEAQREFESRLSSERAAIEEKARVRAREDVVLEISDLEAQVKEKDDQVRDLRERELKLCRVQRRLEQNKETLYLEIQRRLDEERKTILEATEKRYGLKLAEKDKQLADVRRELEEARRKADQGSQERQGTAQEEVLVDLLREKFPEDEVNPFPKGKRGADILQVVKAAGGSCGEILWESKSAANWRGAWLEKLRSDQQQAEAQVAVLVARPFQTGSHGSRTSMAYG